MNTPSQVPALWGPNGCAAAVSITFDNLGEAVDLERGIWPEAVALGQHLSVVKVLPAILKMLDELSLSATFFIEGLNVEMYPAALLKIVEAGHEVGYHAWRHEEWQHLCSEEERQILEHGLRALSTLKMKPYGFRPPGGALTNSSAKILSTLGFTYCSPAGSMVSISDDGLVFLPFEWPIVDAYAYLPRFSRLREKFGDSPEPLSPAQFQARLLSELKKAVRERRYLSLLFHPFVEEKDEYFHVMRSTLAELRSLVDDGTVWCVPCHEVAEWVRGYLNAT